MPFALWLAPEVFAVDTGIGDRFSFIDSIGKELNFQRKPRTKMQIFKADHDQRCCDIVGTQFE